MILSLFLLFFMSLFFCIENVIPLWPAGEVPLSLGDNPQKDIPTLTPYWPDPSLFSYPYPTIIVVPGGGYSGVSLTLEGADYAFFLNQFGIACFVLTYRLGSNGYHYPAEYLDVERAIRLVRYHGKIGDWDVDPNRIGVMGSSAGGHLSALALTRFDAKNTPLADLVNVNIDQVSSKPDLGVLCYPVITMMQDKYTHIGSRDNLLGANSTYEMQEYMSNERYVTNETPPTFLYHNEDDTVVPFENSVMFSEALEEAGVRHEMHLFAKGGHGTGLGVSPYDPARVPIERLLPWACDMVRFLYHEEFYNASGGVDDLVCKGPAAVVGVPSVIMLVVSILVLLIS